MVASEVYDRFEALYAAQHGRIYAFVMNRTGDPVCAEEIVQLTFIRWWELECSGKSVAMEAQKVLFVIAKGLLIDEHRKTSAAKRLAADYVKRLPSTASNGHRLAVDDLQRIIRDAIDALPPRRKRIFEMSRFEELSYREIAEQLGISVSTVEGQMVKAIRELRMHLQPYADETLNPAHLIILAALCQLY